MGNIEHWLDEFCHEVVHAYDGMTPDDQRGYREIWRDQAERLYASAQPPGAVSFSRAELEEVEWSLRSRLGSWVGSPKEKAAVKRAHRKVNAALGGQ